MDLNDDAFGPVRQVYLEYLDERLKNDPSEKRHRIEQFDNGYPVPKDEAKIKAGQEAYLGAMRDGNTELNATNEARKALFKKDYREQYHEREVDPKLYRDNSNYAGRKDHEIEEKVQKKWEEREHSNPNTNQQELQNTNTRKR
jgi:hypothetical protein